MIGHRVKIILDGTPQIQVVGVLHALDGTGARLFRENQMPEQRGISFYPMHRIIEILDLGRAP